LKVTVGGPEFSYAVEFAEGGDAGVVDLGTGDFGRGDETGEYGPVAGTFGEEMDAGTFKPEFELMQRNLEGAGVLTIDPNVRAHR